MNLGFSIYFGLDNTHEENISLLKNAYNLGFTRIFTSLHIPEVNYAILKEEIKEFFILAKRYNMDVISDISPNTFKSLNLNDKDIQGLFDIGVRTIRIDFGYTEEEISLMSKNNLGVKIQLNASTITEDFLNKLDKYYPNYANIEALHNFYPRIGTGISKEFMIKKNKLLFRKGIKVCAFVQSNNRKRSPLKEGLPTLEDHRNQNIKTAAIELFALGNNSVFIGDSLPSTAELKSLIFLKNDAIELRIKVKNNIDEVSFNLLNQTYTSRIDEARDVIRTNESRLLIGENIIYPIDSSTRKCGDITIDNVNYGRYMGDLQILKVDCVKDSRTNIVASILPEDLHLLEYIKEGKKFYFNIT